MRQDPMDGTKQQMHKGVDIRCNGDAVLATENGGKVIAVNHNKNTPGGKSLTVEYARADGSKVQCTYMHLREVSVKVGDSVQAGGRLGISGNTGTRTTGEHLCRRNTPRHRSCGVSGGNRPKGTAQTTNAA